MMYGSGLPNLVIIVNKPDSADFESMMKKELIYLEG